MIFTKEQAYLAAERKIQFKLELRKDQLVMVSESIHRLTEIYSGSDDYLGNKDDAKLKDLKITYDKLTKDIEFIKKEL